VKHREEKNKVGCEGEGEKREDRVPVFTCIDNYHIRKSLKTLLNKSTRSVLDKNLIRFSEN
jgi:hypothetical protein